MLKRTQGRNFFVLIKGFVLSDVPVAIGKSYNFDNLIVRKIIETSCPRTVKTSQPVSQTLIKIMKPDLCVRFRRRKNRAKTFVRHHFELLFTTLSRISHAVGNVV